MKNKPIRNRVLKPIVDLLQKLDEEYIITSIARSVHNAKCNRQYHKNKAKDKAIDENPIEQLKDALQKIEEAENGE